MERKSTYRHTEMHGAGHHSRHRTQRDIFQHWLQRSVTPEIKPLAWDDVANWKGKNVWGVFNGKRQLLHVMSLAPEGNDGERWYVLPAASHKLLIMSVAKSALELRNPNALVIRPPMAIVVYQGAI